MSGARPTIQKNGPINGGRKKRDIPKMRSGIDQNIRILPPYSLIFNQFSSDSNAFEKRKPYKLVGFTFPVTKGTDKPIINVATPTLTIAIAVFISI